MVNYMRGFIPNLSHHTEPLRAILRKDIMFYWDQQVNQSFQEIKALILKANNTLLRYYDRTIPVTVQADEVSECVSYRNMMEKTSPLPARALRIM